MNLYFRYFYTIFKTILIRKNILFTDQISLNFRVLPTDLDLNFHMNNGRYLTICDIGRTQLLLELKAVSKLFKGKYTGVTGGVNITFFRELAPFEKYKLTTQLLTWDDRWFYIQHKFIKTNGVIAASAIARVTFIKNKKIVAPTIIAEMIEGRSIEQPSMPNYLTELILGEKHYINDIKSKSINT